MAKARRQPAATGGMTMGPRKRRIPMARRPSLSGAALGRRLNGEAALPTDSAGNLIWPFAAMSRHAVIFGGSGTGKTETAMRIALEVAEGTDAPIYYLDAKGDRSSAERFSALMRLAGRDVKVFPNQRFDGWRGDWRSIVNRLLEVVSFVSEGPAAYYRDIAKTALRLACNHPDGPPRCSADLLHRLDYEQILSAHGPCSAALALSSEKVSQVRMRYEAFFGQLGSALDGDWSWEDTDAGYFLLDSVALGEDTAGAASLLFSDFSHYFTQRKALDRSCLCVIDEFSAIASTSDLAMKVEQARGFRTSLILVPQTPTGLGSIAQRQRILGSVETVLVHAVNEPDEIAALAGCKRTPEITYRLPQRAPEREQLVRWREAPKIDPDQIRELDTGAAWVIRRGRACRVMIKPAPGVAPLKLPESMPLDSELRPIEEAAPRAVSYLEDSPDTSSHGIAYLEEDGD